MDHWSWRLLKGRHWYLDPAQHLSFGSRSFFTNVAERFALDLKSCSAIPHQIGNADQRIRDTMINCYFGLRRQSSVAARVAVRVMHFVPSFRTLAHKTYVPYTRYVADHVLVRLKKR
jgi:hypothetical protein